MNLPTIVISRYIALEVANAFKDNCINYLDSSGNSFIKHENLFIYISGQKALNAMRTNQARAFQESGLKLIFHLLLDPENLRLTNRQLSELTGISVGSVSNVIRELQDLNFILKTDKVRVLKHTRLLLDRWIISYFDVLRPRLLKKRMHFEFAGDFLGWANLPLDESKMKFLWGGEPAAALLTKNLNPVNYTIYTDQNWQVAAKELRLIPDESGKLEILDVFWKKDLQEEPLLTPKLLIYTDLIGSGIERNIQIANEILENDLQYLKQ